ncbi:MAG: STAS domain-containing protein [Anaerolineae bacterium]|jgi:anti-anti-sigma factor
MEIITQQLEDCDVVRAQGRIDSVTAPALEETFETITGSGRFQIIFDMSQVSFISSVGLRVMIDTQKACRRLGGEVVVVGLSPLIDRAFDLAGYHTLFEVCDTVDDAVDHFRSGVPLESELSVSL